MELIISPPPAARDALPTMVTPLLPPSASSAMSAAAASATRTRAVAAKFRDSSARHFPSPSPSPTQKSLVCWMVVASMPPPLVFSTLSQLLNAHRGSVASCPWRLSSRSPLVCRLAVALPVVMCLRLVSPFVAQPPHASFLDPPSLFLSAGCCVANNICTTSASRRATTSLLAMLLSTTLTSVEVVIVVISRHNIAIVVDFVACRVVAIVDGDTFFRSACVCICTLKIW